MPSLAIAARVAGRLNEAADLRDERAEFSNGGFLIRGHGLVLLLLTAQHLQMPRVEERFQFFP